MAPNVTVSFFAANDINGSPILTITDEDDFFKGLKLTPDLYSLGGWELTLARAWGFQLFDSGAVDAEVFVRFLVHAYSSSTWYYGGVLNKRDLIVVERDELGAEQLTIGGRGPKAYMDRSALGIEQRAGLGFNLDLVNGVWRWNEAATAGRVLDAVVDEDAARSNPSLPDLTINFDDTNDSDGNPWVNEITPGSAEYQTPVGSSLLDVIWDLEDLADLYTTVHLGSVASPQYQLNAFGAFGEDNTGSSFGAGIGLIREKVNIANDSLSVQGVAFRKASHVIVEGKDGVWVTEVRPTWSPGDYVKWDKIEYTRSSSEAVLHRVGLRWLQRQSNGDQELTVEILPGASPATGYYFPAPNDPIWLGNTISLDTVADGSTHSPLDYNNADVLVTGLELELGPAGDTSTADAKAKSWDIKVKLNQERAGNPGAPDQSSAGNGGCECQPPTHSAPEPVPDDPGTVLHLWEWAADALDTIDGVSTAFRFSGVPHAYGPAETAFGAGGVYGSNSAGNYQTSALTVTAGTSYIFETDILWRFDPTFRGLQVHWFSDAGGNTLISTDEFVVGPGHGTNTEYHESVTLTAPATAIRCRVVDIHHFAGIFLDNLSMATVSSPVTQDPYAVNYGGRPHASPYYLPSDFVLDVFDSITASIPGALDDLEDVDASAPTDGQVLTWNATDSEWEAETLPAAPPPAGAVGELLIADTGTSTPLVFADILQNEAQTDLLYGDVG